MGYLQIGPQNAFGQGYLNPQFGGMSTKPIALDQPGGIATVYSTSGAPKPADPYQEYMKKKQGYRFLNQGSAPDRSKQNFDYPAFNEPDLPGERNFDVERYQGDKWNPSQTYSSVAVDTTGVIDATDALLKEKMAGGMSEAARRFGQLGALQSGGGLGAGYLGTLGESERGYARDLSEITNRYRIQAAEADAQRKLAAYQADMNRELAAHEGYEGRRFSDVEMANKYGLGAAGMGSEYDWKKYAAELGKASREQQDAINTLMQLYGG